VIVKVSVQEHSVQIGDETVIVEDVLVQVKIGSDLNITTTIDDKVQERMKDLGFISTLRLELECKWGFVVYYDDHNKWWVDY